jgi:undecaprenyl-phosphate 4-deoxy-4-formamido-L-arabinose transferase
MLDATNNHTAAIRPDLSVVVPVYRSEDCLTSLVEAVAAALVPTGKTYEVVLVNDCSPDRSWEVIEALCRDHPNVVGVDLRRNFGQDNAILTGFRHARGRYLVVMDDDLQHHPRDIPRLLDHLVKERADVVYADFRVKYHRFWKNLGSWFNGKVAQWVIQKPKGLYLSPYKVLVREVAELICNYDGPDPYVDGLIFQVTSRITQLPVEHHRRHAGTSTYTLLKSLKVWGRLAFSFSVRPLRLVTWFGFLFALLGLGGAVWVVCYRLFFPEEFSGAALGWASLIVTQLLLGGIQMVFFGILGEYTGRTYLRVNNKPQTAVRAVLNAALSEDRGLRIEDRNDAGQKPAAQLSPYNQRSSILDPRSSILDPR